MRIEVVYCPASGPADPTSLELPAGSTLADALQASGVLARHGLASAPLPLLGIWARVAAPDTLLRDRDRVEVYRPLAADPKQARRQRVRRR
ncbi:MAG: RnfH family protein [Burkholderiales bacterium]|nr:RnfH family protein [Burkholderiales bacterium]